MDIFFYFLLLGGGVGVFGVPGPHDEYIPPDYGEIAPLPQAPETGDGTGEVAEGETDDTSGTDAPDEIAQLPVMPDGPAETPEEATDAPEAPVDLPAQVTEVPTPPEDLGPAARGLVAETDPPTGKMTTALEVRAILSVTKPQWIAVREYDGQDLLYFTNLLAWRCGLLEVRYSIDGAPLETLPMEPCYLDEATPNAIKSEGIMPYVGLGLGTVRTVHVELVYDDLGTDSADYTRPDILMR